MDGMDIVLQRGMTCSGRLQQVYDSAHRSPGATATTLHTQLLAVPSQSITKHSALTCEDTWCKGYGLSRPPRYSLIILMTTREFFAFSEAVCKTPVGWWSYGKFYSPILIGHQNPLWEIHGNPHSSARIFRDNICQPQSQHPTYNSSQ
jgi:hypothetical protein